MTFEQRAAASAASAAGAAGVAADAPMAGNRVDRLFARLKEEGDTGLIVYVCGGDPAPHLTADVVLNVFAAGADMIELGMPFSDPLADGPVIQRAAQRALAAGTRLAHLLAAGQAVRERGEERPLALLCYVNNVLQHGFDRLPRQLAAAGFDALVVPDLPWEEKEPLASACRDAGIHLVPFLAPTSPDDRIAAVGGETGGFVYCVSLTGVTGARSQVPPEAAAMLARARRLCSRPLALGFGIGSPEQAAQLRGLADAVIVGSAVVERIESSSLDPALEHVPQGALAPVTDFVRQLKGALRGG